MTALVEGARLLAAAAVGLGALPAALAVARAATFGDEGGGRRDRSGEIGEERAHLTLAAHAILQCAVAVLLGALDLYRLEVVLPVEGALAGAGLWALGRGRAGRRGPARAGACSSETAAREGLAERLPLAAAGLLGAVLLWRLLSRAVTDYDSLAYHLPTIARWLQEGGAAWIEQYRGTQIAAYPYAWEAWCGLLALPLHDDVLAGLPGLLAWAQLGLATSCVAQRLGASRVAARLAVVALLSLPIVVEAPATLHVDLAFGACFMTALDLASAAGAGALATGLGLACAAMLPAIKMSGLVYAALLGLVGGLLWALRQRGPAPRAAPLSSRSSGQWATAAGLLGGALGCGGYFYLRNLVLLGNPLGRMEVRLGPLALFAGDPRFSEEVRRTTLAALFHARDPECWRVLGDVLGHYLGWSGLGLVTLALVGVAAARPAARRAVAVAGGLLVTTLVLYWFTPYTGDNGSNGWRITPWIGQALRYGYPAMGALAALAALGLGLLPSSALLTGALAAAPVGLAIWALDRQDALERLHFPSLAPPPGWLLVAGPLLLLLALVGALVRVRWSAPLAVLALLGATAIARPVRDHDRARVYGPVYRYLEEHAGGARLAYALGDRSHPYHGARLARRVRFLGDEELGAPDLEARLAREGVTWLALGPTPPGQSLPATLPLSPAWKLVVPATASPWGGQTALYEWRIPPAIHRGPAER